jgi:DNA polymerase III sliding clamp (beta) subunit (PCNA family)
VKFRVERDVLADAVAWAARSLPARPPVPVLAGLMLDARESGGGLVLSSFDYEVSARVEIAADIGEPGVRWSAAGCSPTSRAAFPTAPSTSPPMRPRWS